MQKTTIPQLFTKTLLAFIKKTYLKGPNASKSWNKQDTLYFSKGILKLSQGFTSQRGDRYQDYFNDPVLRSGYLSYFLPVNLAKVLSILEKHQVTWSKKSLHIVDVGAGPLTMTLALVLHLIENQPQLKDTIKITVDVYEMNAKVANEGAQILQNLVQKGWGSKAHLKVNVHSGNVFHKKFPVKKADFILLGNVLNEFKTRTQQSQMMQKLFKAFGRKDTHVLMMEPGTKKDSRDLQVLHDEILEKTSYKVLGPCLHQNSCPLNSVAKADWCHFKQLWEAPRFLLEFDKITKLKKYYLLYSYLFLQNIEQLEEYASSDFVAISDVMKVKGRDDVIGCGPAGRIRFSLRSYDVSAENKDLTKLIRGEFFSVPELKGREGFEIDGRELVKKKMEVLI